MYCGLAGQPFWKHSGLQGCSEAAGDLLEVLDPCAVGAEVVVDCLQPLRLAVAVEGVAAEEEGGAV